MVDRGTITEEGKDMVIACCDPFHDKQLTNLQGWPDMESACSVVRCVKKSVTVTSAAAGGAIVISTHPVLGLNSTYVGARTNNIIATVQTPSAPIPVFSGLTITRYNANPPAFVTTGATVADYQNLELDDAFAQGCCRLVGMGFEVTDVTAEIYKQGTLTAYRQPEAHSAAQSFIINPNQQGTTSTQTTVAAQIWRKWPDTIADALLIPGTRQWSAADGAYLTVGFNGTDNPSVGYKYNIPFFRVSDTTEETRTSGTNTDDLLICGLGNFANGSAIRSIPERIVPTHQSGVILTGLSLQSTFQINVNYYVETFPNPSDKAILTLATPSAPYDPVALEMISRAMRQLPVAVPVGYNGLGDWFAGVVRDISDAITPLISAASPGLGAISSLAGGAARAYLAAPSQGRGPPKLRKKQKHTKRQPSERAAGAPANALRGLDNIPANTLTRNQVKNVEKLLHKGGRNGAKSGRGRQRRR